ncbi:TraB/GumN family protein [Dyella halodurans]|uniref:TraB/GumN family protein n=1 Tax=Dyella halodurans TaxID=1920171 RepID=A0ABV9C6H0_9GAMM|nr:TraB/GumN family protein [Dyella halodurans]
MQTASRFRSFAVLPLAMLATLGTFAQTAPQRPSPGTAVTLAPVVVSGVLPGPALWKVSRDGHVMWVLGITSPLPKDMQWESSKVEQLIASSQQVLKPPGMGIGANVGLWGRLSLIPSMMGLEKLPDGQTLQQALPPELYNRWLVQKNKYLQNNGSVDRLRPSFAGKKLYSAALSQSGLTDNRTVERVVYAAAKRSKVAVTDTLYVLMLDNPNQAARQFKKASIDDQQCLRGILDAIDQDFLQATERANAWATGDLQTLSKVLSARQQDACLSAIGSTSFAKTIGMTDISNQIQQAWVKAAEAALKEAPQSVALLPMDLMVAGNGYLKALESRGYTVESPESLTESNAGQ